MTANAEVGLPVHPPGTCDCDWHPPEIVGTILRVGQIQEWLRDAGFTPQDVDGNLTEACPAPSPTHDGCPFCDGSGWVPLRLMLNRRWVRGDQALRVPVDPARQAHPYLYACVVALLAE